MRSDAGELARLVWHLDEPLADLSSLGFLAALRARARARDRRARRARAPTSSSAATASTAWPRSPRRWGRVPGPLRAGAAAALRHGPGPRRPARGRRCRPPTRSRACWRRAGWCTPTCSGDLFGGALAEHAGRRRGRAARPAGRRARRRAARGRALPGRAARPGGRHAHLLRPRLDGVLARGARAVPRPRARGARARASRPSHKVRRLQGKHVLRLAARDHVPAFVLDKRKRGFFNEAVGVVGGRRRRRPGGRSCCSARTPPTPRVLDREAVERAVARVARRARRPREPAARADDARGLARRVPAARHGRASRVRVAA